MSDPKTPRPAPSLWKLAGLGTELAGAVIGLTLLGLWLDRRYGTDPWCTVGGAGIGIVGGLYNMVRQSLLASIRRDEGDEPEDRGGHGEGRS